MPRQIVIAILALLAAPALAADRHETFAGPVLVERIGPELDHPWSFAFLPDGAILVTEKDGALKIVDGAAATTISGVPEIEARGQGGLLDVALAPDFAESGVIFLSHAAPGPGGSANTAVTRATLDRAEARLTGPTRIFEMTSNRTGGRHFGSRLAFAPDGTLFVTAGERGDRPSAQDLSSANGKVHRILPDGGVPPDNPFANGGGLFTIWSLGHRNPQGAAIEPATGLLWTVEHGARGGDEVNRPEPGANHGWPVISYGRHYSGGRIGEGTEKPGMVQPLHHWDPSIAPSGAAFISGPMFPAWRGSLLVGALKGRALHRLSIANGRVTGEEVLFKGAYGRVRDVRVAPDGAIWFITDASDGRLHRVTPAPL